MEKFLRFFRHADEDEPHPGPQKLFRPLGELTRISDKILFLAGYVFPSVSYMKYKYGARSKFGAVMYYPVRWGGLAVKAVRQRRK